MTVDERPDLAGAMAEEAVHNNALAEEMSRLAADGCQPEFAAALRAIARNHRIRAIDLRTRLALMGAERDG